MSAVEYVRILRTHESERYLLRVAGQEAGALDLHFLASGSVAGTIVLLEEGAISDDDVPTLLTQIDEQLLPDATFKEHNIFFTVVRGRVLGSFQPDGR